MKINPLGAIEWIQQIDGKEHDSGLGLTFDSNNNIYVTGFTKGVLEGNVNFGVEDIFLMKFNSNGNREWTKQFGTSSKDRGNAITIDSLDNIYITGFTKGKLGENHFGGEDIFLMKLSSMGKKEWTRQLGTVSNDRSYGISKDSFDNVYVTGFSQGTFKGKSNFGKNDILLIKFNSNGDKQWIKQFGSNSFDEGRGIKLDSANNIILTGITEDSFDGKQHHGKIDVILMKYKSNFIKP